MKGFTLVEVLAVILIIAILSVITVPVVVTTISNIRENSIKISVMSIEEAFKQTYFSDKKIEGRI